jgi:hypothetical protein
MTIYHICQKKIVLERDFKYDLKMLILSCIRISAVIHDLEISQDKYTEVYYNQINNEHVESAYSMA